MERFDVVVIGSGNAGQAAAGRARAAGLEVAVVDWRAPGGTCALRGCVPKKVLVAAAEVLDTLRRASAHGIEAGPARLDWAALIDREQALIAGTSESVARSLADRGITLVEGRARFTGPRTVDVDGRVLEARHVVVATGSVPRALSFPGAETLLTSDDVLASRVRFDPVVFIGTGVIAFELAHVLVRAGSKVTLLGRRPLAGFDPDLVGRLVDRSRALGVVVETGATVLGVGPDGVRYRDEQGAEHTVAATAVVNAAGRVPDLADLALEAAGVETVKGLPTLDERLRSRSNPAVSFAGDAVAHTAQLSPLATWEGRQVAATMLGVEGPLPEIAVPRVVFTLPALATVGPSAAEARQAGLDVEVKDNDLRTWRSARTYAEEDAFARVLVERGSGRIVGATLLGHGAPEVIHAFAFAVQHRWTAADLSGTIYAYPTFHADIKYLV